jgi:hypothetical protein
LDIRSNKNHVVAYLPNSTRTNTGGSIVGSAMANNQWINMAFTWSQQYQAPIYKETALQGRNTNAIKLKSGYGGPMTVTLGIYRGNANCTGGDGLDTTQQFIGLFDEFYVFSDEIEKLNVISYSRSDLYIYMFLILLNLVTCTT